MKDTSSTAGIRAWLERATIQTERLFLQVFLHAIVAAVILRAREVFLRTVESGDYFFGLRLFCWTAGNSSEIPLSEQPCFDFS